MTFPVTGDDLLLLIPQRPPFVMIDTLFSAGEKSAVTGFTVPEGHMFVHEGSFSEPGLIENIAQSAAAMEGFAEHTANLEAKVGFIGSIKNLKIFGLPKSGQAIRTEIVFMSQVLDFKIIQGKIFNRDFVFATCEMNIFIKN